MNAMVMLFKRSFIYYFGVVWLAIHSCSSAVSFTPIQSKQAEEIATVLENWRVQGAILEILRYAGLASDPNNPGFWKTLGESLKGSGEIVGKTIQKSLESISERVQKGEITPGQGLLEICINISKAGAQMAWQAMPLIATFAAIGVAAYGAKRGFDVLKEYYIIRMNTPNIIREMLEPKQIKKELDELHYTGQTKEQVGEIIRMAQAVVKNPGRSKFENVLLWGAPGTGKTALVEIIAKEAGMTLIKTTGGDFAKLLGKDLQQIDALFARIKRNRKPVILFIDELENLFGSRDAANFSEARSNVLTKLLAELSEPSSHLLLIGATNRPEDLDEAIHRRLPRQVEIALPDHKGRVAILKLYKKQLFDNDKNYKKEQQAQISLVFSDEFVHRVALEIGEVSPAELQNIMITVKNRSFVESQNGIPNQALISSVVVEKKAALQAREKGFVRSR